MKIKILLPMCFLGKGHGTVPLDVFYLSFANRRISSFFTDGPIRQDMMHWKKSKDFF